MISSTYQNNRAAFPRAELERYRGLWIAFTADGTRIIASAPSLHDVDQEVRAAGENPNQAVFERVPGTEDDICLGGEELACFSSLTSKNS